MEEFLNIAAAFETIGQGYADAAAALRATVSGPDAEDSMPSPNRRLPAERGPRYASFYEKALERVHMVVPGRTTSRTGSRRYFHEIGARSRGCVLQWRFTNDWRFRQSVVIDTGDREENRRIHEELVEAAAEIEKALGALTWPDLDGAQQRRIDCYFPRRVSIESPDEDLIELADWAASRFVAMDEVIRPILQRISRARPDSRA